MTVIVFYRILLVLVGYSLLAGVLINPLIKGENGVSLSPEETTVCLVLITIYIVILILANFYSWASLIILVVHVVSFIYYIFIDIGVSGSLYDCLSLIIASLDICYELPKPYLWVMDKWRSLVARYPWIWWLVVPTIFIVDTIWTFYPYFYGTPNDWDHFGVFCYFIWPLCVWGSNRLYILCFKDW